MDLLPRQRRIFEILLNSRDEYISSNKISDYVGVSNKTVQSDVENLATALESFSVVIESHRGKGFQLRFEGDDEQKLINIMTRLRQQEIQNVDVSLFIAKLLVTPLYTTKQEMMDLILCGTGQLKEILSQAVLELSRHKQIVRSVPGSGFIVTGPELGRRLCYVYHLEVIASYKTTYNRFITDTKYSDSEQDKNIFNTLIKDVSDLGFYINKNSRDYLYAYINYALFRTHNEQSLLSTRHEFAMFRGFQLENEQYVNQIFGNNIIEKRYFYILLQFMINESSYLAQGKMINYTPAETHAVNMIEHFFNRRPNLFNDTFSDIKGLQNEVTTALVLMMRKNSVGFREYQIDLNEMNRNDENIVAIEYASLLAFKIESEIKIEFYQEDIIRLAMLFNIYFYKNIWSQFQNIILYSDNSLMTARFLQRRIKKELPYVKTLVANHYLFPQINFQEDTTLFVVEKSSEVKRHEHVIEVESFSTSNEISQYIRKYVTTTDQKQETFYKLFDESRFHMNQTFERRNEVVEWICDRYNTDSERTQVIQLNVYTREMRYIPTVYGRAAYPKIYLDNIDKPQIELITLKNPMLWGGQEIDVLFIAILPNSYTSLNVLGKPFNELRINLNLIQKIKQAKSFDQFIELTKTELTNNLL